MAFTATKDASQQILSIGTISLMAKNIAEGQTARRFILLFPFARGKVTQMSKITFYDELGYGAQLVPSLFQSIPNHYGFFETTANNQKFSVFSRSDYLDSPELRV